MKKIITLSILIIVLIICFICCENKGVNNEVSKSDIEFCKNFNIKDTIDIKDISYINIQVFQTLDYYMALSNELSDPEYNWYHGKTILYMCDGDDPLYDKKVIKDNMILIGTYTYTTIETELLPSRKITVPVYVSKDYTDWDFIKWIKNINNNYE